MAVIPGTVVAAKITTGDTTAAYPAVDQDEIKGGNHSVADITARDAIPSGRRQEGMTCWVVSTGNLYQLVGGIDNTNWVIRSLFAPTFDSDL